MRLCLFNCKYTPPKKFRICTELLTTSVRMGKRGVSVLKNRDLFPIIYDYVLKTKKEI